MQDTQLYCNPACVYGDIYLNPDLKYNYGVVMKTAAVLMLFILSIFFVTGLWMIDISVIAMKEGLNMINIYGSVHDPVTVFHSGMLTELICFLSIGVIFILGERNYGKNH